MCLIKVFATLFCLKFLKDKLRKNFQIKLQNEIKTTTIMKQGKVPSRYRKKRASSRVFREKIETKKTLKKCN